MQNKYEYENRNNNTETKEMIDKLNSDIMTEMFNKPFEIKNGTQKGNIVISLLDDIITSNNKEERKLI